MTNTSGYRTPRWRFIDCKSLLGVTRWRQHRGHQRKYRASVYYEAFCILIYRKSIEGSRPAFVLLAGGCVVKHNRYTVAWPYEIGTDLTAGGGSYRHPLGEGLFFLHSAYMMSTQLRTRSHHGDILITTGDSIVSSKWSLCIFGDVIQGRNIEPKITQSKCHAHTSSSQKVGSAS